MYTVFTLYYILIPTTWNGTWFPIENYIGLFLQCGSRHSPQGFDSLQENSQYVPKLLNEEMKKKQMSTCKVFMRGCRHSLSMLNNIGTVNETAEPKKKLAGFILPQEAFEKEW